MTDPTPDSLRLSWTVPEGHFDSFVVQFKDRDGPRVVPAEGHERSVTIGPLDASRKYRFLLYGLLGKRRHGPLTAEGTTGEGSPCRGASLIWRPGEDPCGQLWWLPSRLLFGFSCCGWDPVPPLLAQAGRSSPAGCRHGTALSLDLSVLPFSITQPSRNNATISSLCFHLRDPESCGRGWNKTTSGGGAAGDQRDIRLRRPLVDGP